MHEKYWDSKDSRLSFFSYSRAWIKQSCRYNYRQDRCIDKSKKLLIGDVCDTDNECESNNCDNRKCARKIKDERRKGYIPTQIPGHNPERTPGHKPKSILDYKLDGCEKYSNAQECTTDTNCYFNLNTQRCYNQQKRTRKAKRGLEVSDSELSDSELSDSEGKSEESEEVADDVSFLDYIKKPLEETTNTHPFAHFVGLDDLDEIEVRDVEKKEEKEEE